MKTLKIRGIEVQLLTDYSFSELKQLEIELDCKIADKSHTAQEQLEMRSLQYKAIAWDLYFWKKFNKAKKVVSMVSDHFIIPKALHFA